MSWLSLHHDKFHKSRILHKENRGEKIYFLFCHIPVSTVLKSIDLSYFCCNGNASWGIPRLCIFVINFLLPLTPPPTVNASQQSSQLREKKIPTQTSIFRPSVEILSKSHTPISKQLSIGPLLKQLLLLACHFLDLWSDLDIVWLDTRTPLLEKITNRQPLASSFLPSMC